MAHTPLPKQTRGPWIVGTALIVLLCLVGCGVGLAIGPAFASGRVSGVNVVQVCVGVNTIPRWQVGVTWIAPYFSSLPPVFLQNAACAGVPWPSFLPQRGGFAWP